MDAIAYKINQDAPLQTGVDGTDIPSAPEPTPSVEAPSADVESPPVAPEPEQGREPPAPSMGGGAEVQVDADEVAGGASPSEEDDEIPNVLEQIDVAESEIPSIPESEPLAEVSLADNEFLPDAEEAEQGSEPSASPDGDDVGTHVDADEVGDEAVLSEETEAEFQRIKKRWLRRPAVQSSEADPSDDAPKISPEMARFNDVMDEQDPLEVIKKYQKMEDEGAWPCDADDDAPATNSEPRSAPKPEPRFDPQPASDGPRGQGESPDPAPEPGENDGSETYVRCVDTINKLYNPDRQLPVAEREEMMRCSLAALLKEFNLHHDGTMALVDMLYDVDAELYAKCAKGWVKRGLFVSAGSLDPVARYAWNKITIVRPCLIGDLGLTDTADIAMLDVGLGAYIQYLELTADIRRLNWDEASRNIEQVAARAQVNSAAQSSLKIYLGIMKEFSRNKAKKDAEDSGRQRNAPRRSRHPRRTVEKSVAGEQILSEYQEANSGDRLSQSSMEDAEVQS